MSFHHSPVLLADVLSALAPRPGGIYVDGTVGGAGHARPLLKAAGPGARLIGIDRDREALEASRERLGEFGDSVVLIHGNFADLSSILDGLGIDRVDGILLDLGVSSHQLDDGSRGFSFQQDAPLDMRMDRTGPVSAFDLVNTCPEEELAALIRTYGEERMSRRIARAVCSRRETAPIATTVELASVVASAMPAAMRHGPIHPATRTFQALRIAVNGELDSLRRVLTAGVDRLSAGGRFAVIAFHSLEDRMVKEAFLQEQKRCLCPPDLPICVCGKEARLRVLTRKPLRPTEAEALANPRSRSARLRVAERV